jgi:CheY-like chemotaxis protein
MTANSQPTFLYVEDDPMSQQVFQLLMSNMLGYNNLHIFGDSADFANRLRALPVVPDVIFLDIHIQPCDGFELMRMIRTMPDYQDCMVLAMTASVTALDLEQLRQAGFNGLIAKPIRKKVFPDLMRQVLDGEGVWFVS